MSSVRSLANWLKRRLVKSKLPSSLPGQESVSRRTGASAVPISACALGTSHWLGPNSFVNRERATLIGLTCLTTNGRPLMAPKLNRRRAVFVLSKIDEILAWEKATDRERDSKFVELGRYLCEVRAGQYWRVDNVRSFDEFLERKFPESRRKAYYLMAIHEHLTPIRKAGTGADRMDQGDGTSQGGAEGWTGVRLCTLGAQSHERCRERNSNARSIEAPDRQGNRAVGDPLFQGLQEPTACNRAGARNSGSDAWERQVARLLPGDDLCGFSGGSELGGGQPMLYCLPSPGW